MSQTTFEMIREKYKKAEADKIEKWESKKKLMDPDEFKK